MDDLEFIPPQLEPEDMPDVRSLTPEELALVPCDIGKWRCAAEDCRCYARVKDYGIYPMVQFRRNDWVDVTRNLLFCAQHWKLYRPAKKAGLAIPFKLKAQDQLDHELHIMFTPKKPTK